MRIRSSFLALCTLAMPLMAAEPNAVTLETPFLRVNVSPDNGGFTILDAAGGVTWRSNPFQARFGELTWTAGGQQNRANLDRCQVQQTPQALVLTFHPIPAQADAWLRVSINATADGKGLNIAYEAAETIAVDSVRLLDDALWLTDRERGHLAVPVREGLLIPSDSQVAFTHRFDTFAYEGCHMEMLGVVKDGAAALLTWQDPYMAAEARSVLTNAVWVHGEQVLSPSLVLRKTAKAFRLQFLGRGDYVTIGKAYRQIAREKGYRVTWDEKLKGHPERAKLFGAINFKLWSTLDRRMNEASSQEERVSVNWTFDEAAQIAEHLKTDLKLDRVLFSMGGWIHRGYDNQHPDILPTAPECGGDAAFADCARRVRQLGYLFCLHDNYQDIYRDSPSWDEHFIMKNRDGSLTRGGHWAGGMAYLTCSQKALELARRPQNLPAVKKLCDADAYFIDTTYAAGLQECFDPEHPLTRADDMKWKQALSDYSREVFGIFGSECGREWAIPHSDFFEGLTGVSGHAYHDAGLISKVGGTVIPLFEVVYRDGIAMYGKYGYDIGQSAEYVLQHISLGRPLNYHNVPKHLYWQQTNRPPSRAATDGGVFLQANHGWAEGLHPYDRFVKNTAEILSPLNELTAQVPVSAHAFLTADRKVQRTTFGEGARAVEVIVNAGKTEFRCRPAAGGPEALLPAYGFLVSSADFVAFHALEYGGVKYATPSFFTLRSLDGEPLSRSARVRVFHGFGDTQVRIGDTTQSIEREAEVAAAH